VSITLWIIAIIKYSSPTILLVTFVSFKSVDGKVKNEKETKFYRRKITKLTKQIFDGFQYIFEKDLKKTINENNIAVI